LARFAAALEVSPGYLKGGYTMPAHLSEDDILLFADLRNLPYLKLVREIAERGVTAEELRKLVEIIEKNPG
jgi:glutaredoxin 2